MRTRFAPTPSGYLHDGNLVNLLLICWLRDQYQGELALRIDNMDANRQRPEYLQDIFDNLAWFEVRWEIGPQCSADLDRGHDYGTWRDRALALCAPSRSHSARGLRAFVCRCSRRELAASGSRSCTAGCASADLELVTDSTCLRLQLPADLSDLGDPVIWRRDGVPAYHLASVLRDEDLQVTHVVRGEDLHEATQIQLVLAEALGANRVRRATFLHHGLVRDASGGKLSKSTLAQGAPSVRSEERRAQIVALATGLGEPLGITPPR